MTPLSDWGFSPWKQKLLWVLSFDFVIEVVAIGRFQKRTSIDLNARNMSQNKNKVFTIYRIFGVSVVPWSPKLKINGSLLPNFLGYFRFWEDLPSTFPNCECVFSTALWLGILGKKTKASWVLSFSFVIEAVAIGPFPWRTPMQKYDLAVLNPVEHFYSPQNDENAVQFCGDFFNEKKKKDQSQFVAKRK